MTREEKRKIEVDRNVFKDLLKVTKNCFPELLKKLKEVEEKRDKRYITYGADEILLTRILGYIMGIESMNQLTNNFNDETCIKNMKKLLGNEEIKELPHYDTINDFLEKVEIVELEKITKYMVDTIIKRRIFEDMRFGKEYYVVAVDGTGLYHFHERHCKHCLTRKTKDKDGVEQTIYYHHVLEAKLILGDITISIGTEFIENEKEDVEKQDCEIRAFYRLAEKIKKEYPRLKICILGDSLYACNPVIEVCEDKKWAYILRLKEGRQRNLYKEFEDILKIEKLQVEQGYEIVNKIEQEKRSYNVLRYKEDETTFTWISSKEITDKNKKEIMKTGRSRWKIENEGFNTQKNHGYNLGHAYSEDYNAMKAHYYLMQIAHAIRQIGELSINTIKNIKRSLKEMSQRLLECFRQRSLTTEDISEMDAKMQIRFG